MDFNSKTIVQDRINSLIDDAMIAERGRQKSRNYLGASILGSECVRSLQYEFFHAPKDKDFSAQTLRRFERGHWAEKFMIKLFKNAGFDLQVEQSPGKQFGFSLLDNRVAGHADGIFHGGDDCLKYPALWENKCLDSKGVSKLKKDRLKKAYPNYFSQVMLYAAYLNLTENPIIFTALNADTMEIHIELVPFDPQEAQSVSDRAVVIIKACDDGILLPRLSEDPEFFVCKFCSYNIRCWREL